MREQFGIDINLIYNAIYSVDKVLKSSLKNGFINSALGAEKAESFKE